MKRLLPFLCLLFILTMVACSAGSQEPSSPDSPIIRTLATATSATGSADQSPPAQPATAAADPRSTAEPVATFEIPSERYGFPNDCLDTRLWTLVDPQGLGASYENCWMITNLGFAAMDDALIVLVMPSGQDQSYALYTPLPSDARIEYGFGIGTLEVGPGEQVAIRVGIVPAGATPDRDRGIFLDYRNPPGSSESYSLRLWQDDSYSEAFEFLGVGDTEFFSFAIMNGQLTISMNEVPLTGSIALAGDAHVLWVEYFAPAGVTLGGEIGSLTITGR